MVAADGMNAEITISISTLSLYHLSSMTVTALHVTHVDGYRHLSGAQAWRAVHPPTRGSCWQRPRVHEGFLKSWQTKGLAERVVDRVHSILNGPGIDLAHARVILTGDQTVTSPKLVLGREHAEGLMHPVLSSVHWTWQLDSSMPCTCMKKICIRPEDQQLIVCRL